jgi:hypothetical protein
LRRTSLQRPAPATCTACRSARDLIASLGWAFAMAAVFFRWSGLELEQGAPAIGVMAGVILLAAWRLERRVQRLVVQVATDRLVA